MRYLDSIIYSMDMNLSKLQEMVKDREVWRATVHGVTKSGYALVTEQQQSLGHSHIILLVTFECGLIDRESALSYGGSSTDALE